jgi:hypothetical protein
MNLVIDTQTLLDWRFFRDPACETWPLPPGPGPAGRWIATAAMREELAHVLSRPWPARWATPPADVLAFFDRHAELRPAPTPREAQALRCTDPDDQKFIDLAVALAPAWLISRDRAVLKLTRRAALRGVLIRPPAHYPAWHRQLAASSGQEQASK